MLHHRFIVCNHSNTLSSGSVSWQSPSNIALVKYWGKYDGQIPANASLSFTLTNCFTQTTLDFEPKSSSGFDFKVFLDGERAHSFEPKIEVFFNRIAPYLPFLEDFKFTIRTFNSFPHSSGIASSASGLSALALCLMDLEQQMQPAVTESYFFEKSSFLSRLGSGSAARSPEGPIVVWGEHPEIEDSNNLFGIRYRGPVHEVFSQYRDTVLLVDTGQKEVSSTLGHSLMKDHPFAEQRFKQAQNHLSEMISILETGDLFRFADLVEREALSLHAMMLTSSPSFILMKPNTLEILERIRNFRSETQIPVCFTLDAGANVHVLYPKAGAETVLGFIKKKLTPFCKNGKFIEDETGEGAKKIS